MKNKKILYIIPGYEESHTQQKSYTDIAKIFEKAGIQPIHIAIDWHQEAPRCFNTYVEQFLKQYTPPKNAEVFVLGFSFGALIAFLSEPKIQATTLILCSLSPYFTEDVQYLAKDSIQEWEKNFIDSEYSFSDLAKSISTKTHLLVGDEEDAICLKRADSAQSQIWNSDLTVIKNAGHDISQKAYVDAIKDVANTLQ